MFVPFVFTLSPEDDLRYLWVFYRYLMLTKKYGWPMISREAYFEDPDIHAAAGVECLLNYEYDRPTKENIDFVQKYVIPDSLIDKLIAGHSSRSDAFVHLLKSRCELFEQHLRDIFTDIKKRFPNEEIEGILTILSFPSLLQVAKELGIPVIHNEWGPLRTPAYRNTAYLDFTGLFGKSECEARYRKFMMEIQSGACPLLTRQEILALFLLPEYKEAIDFFDSEPEFEMGLATGYAVEFIFQSETYNNNLELIYQAKKHYTPEELLLRTHPGDPSKAAYVFKNRDESPSSIDFIIKSKRVATMFSNIAFEAMLWGKTAYTTGNCAYTFKSSRNLADKTKNIADLEFINFVAFAYLIPYELMIDAEYLRWRLTAPSELDLYKRHLEYYLQDQGISIELLSLPPEKRLYAILEAQGFDAIGWPLKDKTANKDLISALSNLADIIKAPTGEDARVSRLIRQIRHTMYWVPKQQRHIEWQDAQIGDQQAYIENQNAQIAERQTHIEFQNTQIAELQNAVNIYREHISNIENSRVWKLIRLLRGKGKAN